jgi:hypothetical protein
MDRIRQTLAWRYGIAEPWSWLSLCFLRPVVFRERTETMPLRQRLALMLHLCIVIILLVYLPSFLIRCFICLLNVALYPGYFVGNFSLLDPGIISFWFDATWAIVLSCLLGGIFGALFSLRMGIATAVALSMATGINNGLSSNDYTMVSIVFGLSLGMVVGLAFNSIGAIKQDSLTNVTLGSINGVLAGLLLGTAIGSFAGFWAGALPDQLGGPPLQNNDYSLGSATGLLVGGILSCLAIFLLGLLIRRFARKYRETIDLSIRIGLVVAGSLGTAVGTTTGDLGLNLGSGGLHTGVFMGITQGIVVGGAFLLLYIPSYYRLPLFPVNAVSILHTFYLCRANPKQVFQYLHRSSLYYDECVFLHLPRLDQILRIAAQQDMPQTLNEIDFILTERPQQRWAAVTLSYELALKDLSQRTTLKDIGLAHQQLAEFIPLKVRNAQRATALLLRNIEDASREAANYWSLHSNAYDDKRSAYEALQRMLTYLNKIAHPTVFKEQRLNQQLQAIVTQWQILAKQVQETLHIGPENPSQITNPYTVGPALLPIQGLPNPVFVGRDDIVRQLGAALQRIPHPTFCLVGERRMGKSSILLQLPVLLGVRYLFVFSDLQSPGITSSIPAFFASIARSIHKQLPEIPLLERSALDEAFQTNEAEVYAVFDAWLTQVEHELQQRDQTFLLMFDEFEKLEEAHRRGFLDLDLLLGWMRNISLYQSHVVLLFCGIHTIDALGSQWAGYFVNVELKKVSFLPIADARRLIDRAVSPRSASPVFDEEVSEEILDLTKGHPFLLQAVCSKIVNLLNEEGRERAELQDITTAIEEIFDTWTSYFQDIWNRCNEPQKQCLLLLHTQGKATISQIVQATSLKVAIVAPALEQLQQRDLVSQIKGQLAYQISLPIFAEWISRNRMFFDESLVQES